MSWVTDFRYFLNHHFIFIYTLGFLIRIGEVEACGHVPPKPDEVCSS